MFDAPIPRLAPLADYTASASTDSLDAKARSYLHANCAICHLPGGSYSSIDLRFGTPLSKMNICNVDPNKGDQGVTGAKRLFPGSASKVGALAAHGGARRYGRWPNAATRHFRPR